MKTAEQAAFEIGAEFAAQINSTYQETGRRREMREHDIMADGDYCELKREYGEVTREMDSAYRRGYNSAIVVDATEA